MLNDIENNYFNFASDTNSEEDVKSNKENNVYLGKFTVKKYIEDKQLENLALEDIYKYKKITKLTKLIKNNDINYDFIIKKFKGFQKYT